MESGDKSSKGSKGSGGSKGSKESKKKPDHKKGQMLTEPLHLMAFVDITGLLCPGGKFIPGISIPGQGIPGISIPGISIPGISIPGISMILLRKNWFLLCYNMMQTNKIYKQLVLQKSAHMKEFAFILYIFATIASNTVT